MFGYIRVMKPEMRVKEYEAYKAVYCSLCRKLGKSYGILSRLTLSYDFTFLALLEMSLDSSCAQFEKKCCAFNPLKKCVYCKDDEHLELSAASAMIMLYYKILDNIEDEKGIKKLGFMLLRPIFSRAHKKAARKYPQIEKIVSAYISKQSELEKENCADLDTVADPTACAMAQILSLCSEDEAQKRVLDRLGYCIGRYIYILDATCDLEEDIKNGSYNVLKHEHGDIFERVSPRLYVCINEAAKAFELLDIKKYQHILGNIIYLGLEDAFLKELKK